jgi:acetoin utilization protein AcuB
MFVEKWMTPNPFTLPPDTTISAAAVAMSKHHSRHLMVAEMSSSGKRLLGLLAKDDIARAFPDNYNPFSPETNENAVPKPISTIMIRNVVTVEPYCAVEEAVRILRTRRINALPVVRSGNLVGIITENDIYDALLDITGANATGTRLLVESDNVRNALVSMTQLAERLQLQMLNALSFHDKLSPGKVTSVFHLAGKSNSHFTEELRKAGFRVLKID